MESEQIKNFFAGMGIVLLTLGIGLGITESIVRHVMRPAASDSATLKTTRSIEELCKDQTDPYDTPGQCYYSQDDVALMTYATFFGHFPKASTSGNGWATNADHLRYDEDLTPAKDKNEIRIFVTGGSMAWGAGVRQDQLYTKIAEDILRRQFPKKKIRVISAGVGGYVSQHEWLIFRHYLLPLKPDAWVMLTGWNDAYYGYRGWQEYLSPDMMGFKEALHKAPVRKSVLIERFDGGIDASLLPPDWNDYHWKTAYYFDLLLYKMRGVRGQEKLQAEIEALQVPPDRLADEMSETIRMSAHLAKDHHVPFIVYLQPNLYHTQKSLSRFEQDILESNAKRFIGLASYHDKAYALMNARLKSIASQNGFLYRAADEAIKNESRSLFADHVHFGDRGNRLIGEHLARLLTPVVKANGAH